MDSPESPKVVQHVRPANEQAVSLLRTILQDAEQGHIQGFALVGFNQLGEVATAYTDHLMPFAMIGGLEAMKQILLVDRCAHLRQQLGLDDG